MTSGLQIRVKSLADLPDAARNLLNYLTSQPIKQVAFYGQMGAGKTTLITAMLSQMSIGSSGSSPTFALVSEYRSPVYGKIYHCDFYRLKEPAEALDIGIEDMFQDDAWCFMEWPEKLGNLLPPDCVKVRIEDQNGSRIIEVSV